MPESAPESPAATMPGFATPMTFEPFVAVNQRGLSAALEVNDHILKRMAKVGSEVFQFVDRRLKHDLDTAKDLASCTTPQDAVTLYGQYVETTMRQYSEEISLLANLYSEQARETMEEVQQQARQTIEPVTADSAT